MVSLGVGVCCSYAMQVLCWFFLITTGTIVGDWNTVNTIVFCVRVLCMGSRSTFHLTSRFLYCQGSMIISVFLLLLGLLSLMCWDGGYGFCVFKCDAVSGYVDKL